MKSTRRLYQRSLRGRIRSCRTTVKSVSILPSTASILRNRSSLEGTLTHPTISLKSLTVEGIRTRNQRQRERTPSARLRKKDSNRLSLGPTRTRREAVMDRTSLLLSLFLGLRATSVDTSRIDQESIEEPEVALSNAVNDDYKMRSESIER